MPLFYRSIEPTGGRHAPMIDRERTLRPASHSGETGAMLKQIGIVAFGLVVVATSSSAFAQQARPLTRGITVQAAPVAAKPVAATRAIAIEEKVAAAPEISAEA